MVLKQSANESSLMLMSIAVSDAWPENVNKMKTFKARIKEINMRQTKRWKEFLKQLSFNKMAQKVAVD